MADLQNFNRVRVGGSGFTVFRWRNEIIAFASQIAHTSPAPVAQPVPIQPMDAKYPVQVITPEAATMGTIVLELTELYGQNVWERLGSKAAAANATSAPNEGMFSGAIDIVNIFRIQASESQPIQVTKFIQPPTLRGRQIPAYTEEYHNVVVTNVEDGETIAIGTMEVVKRLTLGYTHMTRGGVRGDAGRERSLGAGDFIAPPGA